VIGWLWIVIMVAVSVSLLRRLGISSRIPAKGLQRARRLFYVSFLKMAVALVTAAFLLTFEQLHSVLLLS